VNVFGKIVAVASLAILPFSATLWYRSYSNPYWQRFDLTLHKSVWLYLESGICDMEVLSMPTKTASKSEFVAPVVRGRHVVTSSFRLNSRHNSNGYRTTWIAFPLSFSTILLALMGTVPILIGPVKRWRRKRGGLCLHCGYNLSGSRSGRCPECGLRYHRTKRRV